MTPAPPALLAEATTPRAASRARGSASCARSRAQGSASYARSSAAGARPAAAAYTIGYGLQQSLQMGVAAHTTHVVQALARAQLKVRAVRGTQLHVRVSRLCKRGICAAALTLPSVAWCFSWVQSLLAAAWTKWRRVARQCANRAAQGRAPAGRSEPPHQPRTTARTHAKCCWRSAGCKGAPFYPPLTPTRDTHARTHALAVEVQEVLLDGHDGGGARVLRVVKRSGGPQAKDLQRTIQFVTHYSCHEPLRGSSV